MCKKKNMSDSWRYMCSHFSRCMCVIVDTCVHFEKNVVQMDMQFYVLGDSCVVLGDSCVLNVKILI